MAQYRLSASVIKRSEGRSVTASAAYRAAESIYDERTGITHDYSRKGGVLSAEIMAPADTPDWMFDRHRLWNAVEAAERRKDSQLAREILLSLPHELNDRQRRELVRGFVQERYVDKGMIADVAIHEPGRNTDDRNHHAHILLTMREITGAGFGSKHRISEPERIQRIKDDREAWADHQNRMFERLNMPERVDHRSYTDRGIDREPTRHLGPSASEIERTKRHSRVGDENRRIVAANSNIAESYRTRAEADRIRETLPPLAPMRRRVTPVFNYYAADKKLSRKEQLWAQREHERRIALENRERHELIDLQFKHNPQLPRLKAEMEERNGVMKRTIQAEMDAIDARAKAKGVTRFFRNLTGRTQADAESRRLHQKTLDGVAAREKQEIDELARRQERDRIVVIDRYRKLRQNLEDNIALMAERRAGNRSRPMARDEDKKRVAEDFAAAKQHRDKARDKDRSIPKPAPTMQPAPPRGAGRSLMPPDKAAHDRNFERWKNSAEGRAVWDDKPARPRDDFTKSGRQPDPKPPAPEPKRPSAKDIWDDVAPKSERTPDRPRRKDRERD